jgi:hypothetical protein
VNYSGGFFKLDKGSIDPSFTVYDIRELVQFFKEKRDFFV